MTDKDINASSPENEEISENAENSEDLQDIPVNTDDEEDAVSEYNDTAAQVAELEEKISELEAKLEESNEKFLRMFADYDNYRKRTAREKSETYSNAVLDCANSILPVVDSFERAVESECTDENYKKGMTMIFTMMKDFLTKMNVTELEALGKEFDPNFHNAVRQLPDTDYAANHVCEVYQKGYMLGDKLLRPAMVAVACE